MGHGAANVKMSLVILNFYAHISDSGLRTKSQTTELMMLAERLLAYGNSSTFSVIFYIISSLEIKNILIRRVNLHYLGFS